MQEQHHSAQDPGVQHQGEQQVQCSISSPWESSLQTALDERREQGLWRERVVNHSGSRSQVAVGQSGSSLIQSRLNFAANDYLGLSQHPQIVAAWQEGARRYGIGSGASGHVSGYTEAHAGLEQALAQWLGYERALLFVSGFSANQAVIHALCAAGDLILADKLTHASLLEAAMLSPATLRRFRHNDLDSLAGLLQGAPKNARCLVVTEGVFSMDGDQAPLREITALAERYGAWLLVDDAHGTGILGAQGQGSCMAAGVRPHLQVVTFGKAWGGSGAAVLCSQTVADYLVQFSRHLIYSTAMPPAQACALSAALQVLQQAEAERQHLNALITQFREGCADLPYHLLPSGTPIQPLVVGDNAQALQLARYLQQRGIWAPAIRPPTVPPGTARLRITLTAAHSHEDVAQLLAALHDAATGDRLPSGSGVISELSILQEETSRE